MVQTMVSNILYSGHASKKVYKRLQKLGVSVSHKTATTVVKKLGVNFNHEAFKWRDTIALQSTCTEIVEFPGFIVVGDNFDKNIKARDVRLDNQNRSVHSFQSYSSLNRVDISSASRSSENDIKDIPVSSFLPTISDCSALKQNYAILMARIVVDEIPHFHELKGCVPKHIIHQHSEQMKKKSETVPLGVIPENENTRDGMMHIMEELHKLVPKGTDTSLLLMGDQLTVERARKSKEARINSSNEEDALLGLEPAICDWHAECAFLQILFDRLYKGGSNLDVGTLLQLRNSLNRRNVAGDISNKFNASIDFFELIVKCHIIAAAMEYFGMKNAEDSPSCNSFPLNVSKECQWKGLNTAMMAIIERFVIVQAVSPSDDTRSDPPSKPVSKSKKLPTSQLTPAYNPHVIRIENEHCYCRAPKKQNESERVLPASMKNVMDYPAPSSATKAASPDKVMEYACTVLTDGLLLLEFRDGIHEGDGERVARCWRLFLLYFFYSGHKKYALEALTLQACINGLVSERSAQEMIHNRFVNTQGGMGRNIPTDLHMEHLNRTLKDYLVGLGANISEEKIVETSKSLKSLMDIMQNFDEVCEVKPESLHHTKKSSKKDQQQVLSYLLQGRVFDYIPGRSHNSFRSIRSRIGDYVNMDRLVDWIRKHQSRFARNLRMKEIFFPK